MTAVKKKVKAAAGKKKIRMLCVTDQRELKQLISRHFGKYFDLVEANTGEKGISQALIHKPHVVLMDQNLHNLSGVDAARTIKHHLPNSKIIMLTMYQCDSCPTGI